MVTFDTDKLQRVPCVVSVVEKQFFSWFDIPFREYSDSMVAIDEFHAGVTIGVNGMVSKSNFVAFPGRIHYEIVVQIE